MTRPSCRRKIWLLHHPPSPLQSASCHSSSVLLCVAGRTYCMTGEMGKGSGVEPNKVWLKSLAYPSGEEGGKFLVQMISTCLRYMHVEEGGRGSAPCGLSMVTATLESGGGGGNGQVIRPQESLVLYKSVNTL
jgi:hypothetical protein